METKHTAGEWDAWINGCSKYSVTGPAAAAAMAAIWIMKDSGHRGHYVELASQSLECPGIALGDTKERAEANARLIAAAPDLLEALEQIATATEATVCNPEWVAMRARTAIAKATGA